MGDMAYSRDRHGQYSGFLVQLYRRIISMLRHTTRYHKLLYAGDEDFPNPRRRSRFSFRGKRRVKISKFGGKQGGRFSSPFSNNGEAAHTLGERPKARGFRIRRKSITLPLVVALRKVRDAYVNFMIRLASNSHNFGGLYGAPSAFDISWSKDRANSDQELIERLQRLAESRASTRLTAITGLSISEDASFPRGEITVR